MSLRGSASVGFRPPEGQTDGLRQQFYALERRRWREGFATFMRGGRLVMRVQPTYRLEARDEVQP